MHRNVHDNTFNESRGNIIVARAMPISSAHLGLSGECDVVEFHKSKSGIELFGHEGKYKVVPIEYKHGKPKENECDILQLTAQAMCLEDMLCCQIPYGYMFYGETRRRLKVDFSDDIRKRTQEIIGEMHKLYSSGYTPKVKRTKSCNACSIKNICLPVLGSSITASDYVRDMINSI